MELRPREVAEGPGTSEEPPYLSVIVTARNDDHGGNLLGRMQTFINALVGQARRHGLAMELILVEWNPPPEKLPLAEALRWPRESGPCAVRIVEVPAEVHQRYKHAGVLPLYQMIAKNVGIRRARGRFVLATNIDILFSGELGEFLAERRLERGRMYRLDRYDVMAGVPVEAPVEEQLEYCRSHLLRVNAREGTLPLTPEGLRALSADDIAAPGCGVWLGRGWYPVEQYAGQVFRWVGDEAEFTLEPPHAGARVLRMELEPGPGVRYGPFRLRVSQDSGNLLAEVWIRGRSLLRLRLASAARQTFSFRVPDGGGKAPGDPRVLSFRVIRCAWEKGGWAAEGAVVEAQPRRLWHWIRLPVAAWRVGRRAVRFLRQRNRGVGPARLGLPLSRAWIQKLEPRLEGGGLTVAVGSRRGESSRAAPAYLHTNACGDFTLMAREHWWDVRGYPEFDMYSFNLDSVLCYAAHYGGAREEVLTDPLRIYHLEHASGSGWTPEGATRLFERLDQHEIPWLDYHELMQWAQAMQRLDAPMIFNRGDWGLAGLELRETVVWPRGQVPAVTAKEG